MIFRCYYFAEQSSRVFFVVVFLVLVLRGSNYQCIILWWILLRIQQNIPPSNKEGHFYAVSFCAAQEYYEYWKNTSAMSLLLTTITSKIDRPRDLYVIVFTKTSLLREFLFLCQFDMVRSLSVPWKECVDSSTTEINWYWMGVLGMDCPTTTAAACAACDVFSWQQIP